MPHICISLVFVAALVCSSHSKAGVICLQSAFGGRAASLWATTSGRSHVRADGCCQTAEAAGIRFTQAEHMGTLSQATKPVRLPDLSWGRFPRISEPLLLNLVQLDAEPRRMEAGEMSKSRAVRDSRPLTRRWETDGFIFSRPRSEAASRPLVGRSRCR